MKRVGLIAGIIGALLAVLVSPAFGQVCELVNNGNAPWRVYAEAGELRSFASQSKAISFAVVHRIVSGEYTTVTWDGGRIEGDGCDSIAAPPGSGETDPNPDPDPEEPEEPDPTPAPTPGPTPTPPPPSAGFSPPSTPHVDEDFTAYADMADFEARSPYSWGHSNLQGWGPNNVNISSRGLMYRFRQDNANPCRDQRVGEATVQLPAGTKRLWLEFDVEWGPNYTNVRSDNACAGGKYGYKFILSWLNGVTSGGERRYSWIADGDQRYEFSVPGYPTRDDVPVNPGGVKVPGDATTKTYPPETVRSGLAGGPKAGQTQHYRLYMGEESPGVYRVFAEVDGVVTHDYTTNSVDDGLSIQRLMLGSNRNSWPERDVFMWWKNFRAWTASGGQSSPPPAPVVIGA